MSDFFDFSARDGMTVPVVAAFFRIPGTPLCLMQAGIIGSDNAAAYVSAVYKLLG